MYNSPGRDLQHKRKHTLNLGPGGGVTLYKLHKTDATNFPKPTAQNLSKTETYKIDTSCFRLVLVNNRIGEGLVISVSG